MGLIETEISELRNLLSDVMSGKVNMQQASMQLAIFNQIGKRERLMFDIWKTASEKRGVLRNVLSKNLLGAGTALDIKTETEITLSCPEMGGTLITPEKCLDHSGDEKNISNCQRCENFSITRKRLLK